MASRSRIAQDRLFLSFSQEDFRSCFLEGRKSRSNSCSHLVLDHHSLSSTPRPKLISSSTNNQQRCPHLADLCRHFPTLRMFKPLKLPRYPNVVASHREGYGNMAPLDMDPVQRSAAQQHWNGPLASHGLGLRLLQHNEDIKEWVHLEQRKQNLSRPARR